MIGRGVGDQRDVILPVAEHDWIPREKIVNHAEGDMPGLAPNITSDNVTTPVISVGHSFEAELKLLCW